MKSLDPAAVEMFESIAAIVVPDYSTLSPQARLEAREIVDHALLLRPESLRRQLGFFLKVLRFAPAAVYGRPFERLSERRAGRVLAWFQESRIQKLRQGIWGLKTLIFMGFYGRREAWTEIGYAPDLEGTEPVDG